VNHSPKCLVIIPTYNEKENVEAIIRKIFSIEEKEFHVLIVDDNSPDGTALIVKKLQNTFPEKLFIEEREGKQGLGTAYILGFRWALKRQYDYIFEMDADFSHNPDDLLLLYNACYTDGADMSVGSRYIPGGNVVNWPVKRVFISYYASIYVWIITRLPVRDTTAGFVCYSRLVLKTLENDLKNIRFKGYAFQIEMKFLTWKYRFKIKEVPIIFTDRTKGDSKMSKSIIWEAVFGVIQMKLKSFFGIIDKK
jgi:dolichol-phosphate mannosyltransferase